MLHFIKEVIKYVLVSYKKITNVIILMQYGYP